MLLGWSYPEVSQSGFWSPRTSTMNFCEIDYYMTDYVAEFINTISNFSYLGLAWAGINQSIYRRDFVALVSYAQLGVVGLGSIAFHSSLKFYPQIVDEVAMLYATATVLFAVFTIGSKASIQFLLGIVLLLFVVGVSAAHVYQDESLAHRICFGVMVVIVAARCTWLLRKIRDPIHKAEMKRLAVFGSVTFVTGFGLWIVDVSCCNSLRIWREKLGMPLGFLIELHGWWHILTAYGVYYYLVFVDFLRLELSEGHSSRSGHSVRLSWDVVAVPRVVDLRIDERKMM